MKSKIGDSAVISLFVPGVGQVIKGQDGKGILIFLSMILLSFTVIGAFILWIWQVFDEYNTVPNAINIQLK